MSDDVAARPREVRVRAGSDSARYTLLLAGGAEPSDTGWTVTGFVAGAGGVAGARDWSTEGVGRCCRPR